MVKIFGRGKEEKERQAQFSRDITSAHIQGRSRARAMNITDQQQLNSLGRGYFLQQDENVLNLILTCFPSIMPIFSRLNATSRLIDKRERRKLALDIENVLHEERMELDEDDENYSLKMGLLNSFDIYATYRLADAWEGYRGKLVTEEIERTTVQVEQPKKKRLL